MKKFAMAVALMCALSPSTFAGNMPTVGIADPAPPTTSSTSGTLLVSVIVTILSLR